MDAFFTSFIRAERKEKNLLCFFLRRKNIYHKQPWPPFRTTAVILYLLIFRFIVIIALYLLFPHVSIVSILLLIIILRSSLWYKEVTTKFPDSFQKRNHPTIPSLMHSTIYLTSSSVTYGPAGRHIPILKTSSSTPLV